MADANTPQGLPRGSFAFFTGLCTAGLGFFWFFGLGNYQKILAPLPGVAAYCHYGLVYERLPEFCADFGSRADQVCWGINSVIAGLAVGFAAKIFWLIFFVPPEADLLDDAHFEQEHRSLPSPAINHLVPVLRSCPQYDFRRIQRDLFIGRIPLRTPGTDRPSTELD